MSARLPAPAQDGPALVPSTEIRRLVLAGGAVLVVFFGGLGTWAATAPLAGAAIAPGVVAVEGQRQALQHPDGGVVQELAVGEGDRVARGQLLLRLADTAARAELDVLIAQHDALKALEARLLAERDGKERPVFEDFLGQETEALAELMANQTAIFETRQAQLDGETGVLRRQIAQLGDQVRGFDAEREAVSRQLVLIEDELVGIRSLYEKGYASKTRLLELERTAAGLTGQKGSLTAEIAQARQSVGEAELRILQLRRERATEIADELRETQAGLVELAPGITAARDVLARTELRAPAAGQVVELTAFTIGGVVAPGERVLDIVPSEGTLLIEARLRPEDVEQVTADMAAEVRLVGVAQSRQPVLDGHVSVLSADRVEDEQGEAFYAVQVRLDEPERRQAERFSLQAGMPVEVTIVTRPRSALDYLMEPLTNNFSRAFREE